MKAEARASARPLSARRSRRHRSSAAMKAEARALRSDRTTLPCRLLEFQAAMKAEARASARFRNWIERGGAVVFGRNEGGGSRLRSAILVVLPLRGAP